MNKFEIIHFIQFFSVIHNFIINCIAENQNLCWSYTINQYEFSIILILKLTNFNNIWDHLHWLAIIVEFLEELLLNADSPKQSNTERWEIILLSTKTETEPETINHMKFPESPWLNITSSNLYSFGFSDDAIIGMNSGFI